jgi:hypothetical protein
MSFIFGVCLGAVECKFDSSLTLVRLPGHGSRRVGTEVGESVLTLFGGPALAGQTRTLDEQAGNGADVGKLAAWDAVALSRGGT